MLECAGRTSILTVDAENDSDEEFNASDIDLNASYSDSDDLDNDKMPIEDKKFWEYHQKLEENNLFEMNLFQDRT